MNQTADRNIASELTALDDKINALLPSRYQHCYTSVSPNSMGSAGLKYGPDGRVAWDEIWTSFCDLALAGGPPHRGTLLEPVPEKAVATSPTRYQGVVAEIGRAVRMTTCLSVVEGYAPGWVGVRCESQAEAGWLQFAVNAENVSARRREAVLYVPAGPDFRPEKEIKNVVVALAKATHYWDGHLSASQQSLAGGDIWEAATPTEAAAAPEEYEMAIGKVMDGLRAAELPTLSRRYVGWVGVGMADEEDAVWLLRAILAARVLARREEYVIHLPVGATPNAGQADRVVQAFRQAWDLRKASAPRRQGWRSFR